MKQSMELDVFGYWYMLMLEAVLFSCYTLNLLWSV